MKKAIVPIVILVCMACIPRVSEAWSPWSIGDAKATTFVPTVLVFPPTSQVTVSTLVPVGISATYMVIKSTALIVTYSQVGRVPSEGPAITTSTAKNGQYLILSSTTSVDTVVITTGIATAVYSPSDATITISAVKNPMAFIFDATLSVWRAIGKQ